MLTARKTLAPRRKPASTHRSTQPRAIRGKAGQWLGLPVEVILNGWVCHPFVCMQDDKLHVIHVPEAFRDAIFKEMHMSWSWSKNAALRYLMDAVLLSPKPNLWHHGMVSVGEISSGRVVSLTEHHSDKNKRVAKPWEQIDGTNKDTAGRSESAPCAEQVSA